MFMMSVEELAGLKTLGQRLRYVRKQKELTQEQLAVKCGTNQAVIQKIENGNSMRPQKIEVIAAVLDVTPQWLQFGNLGGSAELQFALNSMIEAKDEGLSFAHMVRVIETARTNKRLGTGW